jgi:SAM-dependent methyltransferase
MCDREARSGLAASPLCGFPSGLSHASKEEAMQLAVEANERFLNTAAPRAATDWDSLLAYQVDLAFPQELKFLLSLKAWSDAGCVLDAGCGNGYYLSRLHEFFPEKRCFGVDISPELVAIAARRHPDVAVSLSDFTRYAPNRRFDLIIMRFLVQHLKDFGAVLNAADRLLTPTGRLLIIESDLAASGHHPDLPALTDMLLTFARVSGEQGAIKPRLLTNADGLVRETDPRWSVEHQESIANPQVGPFGGSKLLAVYRLWIDLCERSKMFRFDFDRVRDELDRWSCDPATFSNVALRMIVMKR